MKVSVLMTAYNNAPLIDKTIESVLKQTFKDFELIICDDNSSDNTWQVISEYAQKNPQIRVYRNEKNLGIAANRNRLLSLATGTYSALHDNDDISLPHRLETQHNFMAQHPEIVACGSFLEYFDEKGNRSIRKYYASDKKLKERIFRDCPIGSPSLFVRTQAAISVGGFGTDYKFTDDYDMYFRLSLLGKLANIQEVLVKYRRHNNANSIKSFITLEKETLEIRYKYAKKFQMSFFDRTYNFMEWISVYIVPANLKIWIFTTFRNSKI